MKAAELIAKIESETASFEARKAEKGIMAAIAGRKDHAMLWAAEAGVACPSVDFLRANAEKELAEIAAMLTPVSR